MRANPVARAAGAAGHRVSANDHRSEAAAQAVVDAIRRGGLGQVERLAATAVPLGRSGTADEVAQAAPRLASDQPSCVHGTVIDVAGRR